MKFLKLLFTYLLVGTVLLTVFSLFTMFLLSYIETSALSRAMSKAKQMSSKPSHVADCLLGEATDEYPLLGYQVRFENNQDYVVEALCTSSVKGPFEVSRSKLRFGVTKAPSYSGVLFSTLSEESYVGRVALKLGYAVWVLESGDKGARVSMKPFLTTNLSTLPPAGEASAKASCDGWGYQCCNPLTQVGVGVSVSDNIASCNDSCYSSCLERPSILVFTTEQDINANTREVDLSKSAPNLLFSYSVQDVDSESILVSIDYGDGETATSSNHSDQFSHTYNCKEQACTYTVSLVATDSDNLINSRTRISEMLVNVK